jgi:GNAT superfamily N-acetyltransferase
MDLHRVDADDHASLAAWVDVHNAAEALDAPWQAPLTVHRAQGDARYGWDGEPDTPFLGCVDGEPVAAGWVSVSDYDNLDAAWLGVRVRPDLRRRGLGSAVLTALERHVRDLGRGVVGTFGWAGSPAEAFVSGHGFEARAREAQRRQVLAEVDWADIEALHAEAGTHAGDYELVRWTGRAPEDELPALAALTASINDAPTDDLTWEDEVFPTERIAAYERVQQARGDLLHRLVARHRVTGELAGHTVVAVDGERPALADQHDTAVAPAHRGHRLGLLLKTGMNLWLRETQPQLERIDTWNAESNRHMLAVNDVMGYRVVGRAVLYQRP